MVRRHLDLVKNVGQQVSLLIFSPAFFVNRARLIFLEGQLAVGSLDNKVNTNFWVQNAVLVVRSLLQEATIVFKQIVKVGLV
jgi:hypothetical protein